MNSTREQVIRAFLRDENCEDWTGENFFTENFRIFGTEQCFKGICARAGVKPRRTRGAVQYASGDGFTLRHYNDGDRIVLTVNYYA